MDQYVEILAVPFAGAAVECRGQAGPLQAMTFTPDLLRRCVSRTSSAESSMARAAIFWQSVCNVALIPSGTASACGANAVYA